MPSMHKGKTTMVGCIAAEAPWLKTANSMDLIQPGMTNSRNPGWGFWQFPSGCSIYWHKDVGQFPGCNSFRLVVCFASRGIKYLRIYVHMSLPSSQMVFPGISIFPDSTVKVFWEFRKRAGFKLFMHWQRRLCTTGRPNYQHCSGEWGPREAWNTSIQWRKVDKIDKYAVFTGHYGPWMCFNTARSWIPVFSLHGSKKRCQIWSRRCKS